MRAGRFGLNGIVITCLAVLSAVLAVPLTARAVDRERIVKLLRVERGATCLAADELADFPGVGLPGLRVRVPGGAGLSGLEPGRAVDAPGRVRDVQHRSATPGNCERRAGLPRELRRHPGSIR
jgi:hypothetical protein